MIRRAIVTGLLAACLVPLLRAADPPKADEDQKKLQGVWHSPAGSKSTLKILFMGDKIGFTVEKPGAKPPDSTTSFVGLSPAKRVESDAKQSFEIQVAKDYTRRVDYRFEPSGLKIGVDGAEYDISRVNTRAADNPVAKKLVGTWTVTGLEAKGKPADPKTGGLETVVFTEDRYVWKAPGGKEILSSFFRLGEEKNGSTELDVFGAKPDVSIPALLEMTGDEIRLAQPLKPYAKGAVRPTGFDTTTAEVLVVRAKRAN